MTIPTVKLVSELVRDDNKIKNERLPGDSKGPQDTSLRDESTNTDPSPFEIRLQFDAHDGEISSILYDGLHTLITCGGIDNSIKEWKVPRSIFKSNGKNSNQSESPVPELLRSQTLHTAKITCMKQIYCRKLDKELIVTFSLDGTFTLLDNGAVISVISNMNTQQDCNVDPILSADIDEKEGLIFIGTNSGFLEVYSIDEITTNNGMTLEESSNNDHTPKHRFCVYTDEGVSALRILSSSNAHSISTESTRNISANNDIYTCGILTGGANGLLKRWEVMGRRVSSLNSKNTMPFSIPRLDHWPRLESQRFREHAHTFKAYHSDAITDLNEIRNVLLSCSNDGSIRIWSPQSGEMLYFMEGFDTSSNTTSLVYHDGSLLVTSGMKNYVCLHDFDSVADLTDDE